ncbi:MAG: aspartate aminotransferase family protein [Cytophagaceae bacterium]|nr:aspartate aminotransferase family protein [Cytophagaceae bacterium]MDW8455181.1 aspartate aminotransferase family protein [Cytophagaceae bacterium]
MNNRQIFLNLIAQTSLSPLMLEIERGEGIYLYDATGKPYMDLISGISVSNVGHSHPHVVQAVQRQAARYMHTMVYGEYIMSPQLLLADALRKTLPQKLDNIYFVNSGSEAVEGAVKLAKRYTGRYEIISCFNAYHGSTQGALSLAGSGELKNAYRPLLPGVSHIRFNDVYELSKINEKTAAVIIEPVQGEAGLRVADKDYLLKLRARCDETGALLIFDEIQSGFGRTGTFWCFEQYDVLPDILVTAKAMGGGLPLGAFISSKKIMHCLTHHPALGHITTYGGNPVCCAASLAAFEVMMRENLLLRVAEKERSFRQYLNHPKIKEVRSKGLMIAVEFESFDILKRIIERCLEYGVITDWFLFCNNSMRIAPPLIITDEQIEQACGLIMKAVDES